MITTPSPVDTNDLTTGPMPDVQSRRRTTSMCFPGRPERFDAFFRDQRLQPGRSFVTIAQFDTSAPYEVLLVRGLPLRKQRSKCLSGEWFFDLGMMGPPLRCDQILKHVTFAGRTQACADA